MESTSKYNRPVPSWALPITRLVFICALAVLTYNSVRPVTDTTGIPNIDKVLHAAAYFVLASLLALALPKLRLGLVVLYPCLFGAAMEVAQATMSAGRTGSILDMAANITGAVMAVMAWRFFVAFVWKRAD